uniref:Putative secreted peptide n=1 Tax=Anopheles braziliensis TaxID=58242 RepID=A0A2M3ZW11_9DIPT
MRTVPISASVFFVTASARQERFRSTDAVTWTSSGRASWATSARINSRFAHSSALLLPWPKVRFVRTMLAYRRSSMYMLLVELVSRSAAPDASGVVLLLPWPSW